MRGGSLGRQARAAMDRAERPTEGVTWTFSCSNCPSAAREGDYVRPGGRSRWIPWGSAPDRPGVARGYRIAVAPRSGCRGSDRPAWRGGSGTTPEAGDGGREVPGSQSSHGPPRLDSEITPTEEAQQPVIGAYESTSCRDYREVQSVSVGAVSGMNLDSCKSPEQTGCLIRYEPPELIGIDVGEVVGQPLTHFADSRPFERRVRMVESIRETIERLVRLPELGLHEPPSVGIFWVVEGGATTT